MNFQPNFKFVSVFFFLLFSFSIAQASIDACLKIYGDSSTVSKLEVKRIEKTMPLSGFLKTEQSQIDSLLERTKDYEEKIGILHHSLKRNELQDMYFRTKRTDGSVHYYNMYRNFEFLKGIEFMISKTIPDKPNLIRNVSYGYRNIVKEDIKDLGEITAIELDNNNNVSKVFFASDKQRDNFKAHFFGRPFTRAMKNKIVDVNTAIFKELSRNPTAVKKVADFEKSRGWPAGTADKMGLVYYSKNVLDLKKWAFQNRFSYGELVDAGWLSQNIKKDGQVVYLENYDDSIKIPFRDTVEKSKIAFWRTRNLSSRPNLPKYLSWPKDRSLFEVETLFEEIYNGWNLDKAKGKKVVITEGEFKCAIGEMNTGILHLGIPGISQFSSTVLESLLRAQPSEVIVLFDRDPVGKGLVRLDEVTDSQRASYTIAKRIEAAGIPVKVTSLPDVYNGGKVGIDDLILTHGPAPYLKALNEAQAADDYAKTYKIDVTITQLTARKNRVNKTLRQFESANKATLGFITLEQRQAYTELVSYHASLELAFKQYLKLKYPGRFRLSDPSSQFEIIQLSSKKGDRLQSATEDFAIEGPLLKLGIRTSDVKNCTKNACFELNKKAKDWNQLSQKEKFAQLSIAMAPVFPKDDYVYVEAPLIRGKIHPLMVIRKDSRSPVAIVDEF